MQRLNSSGESDPSYEVFRLGIFPLRGRWLTSFLEEVDQVAFFLLEEDTQVKSLVVSLNASTPSYSNPHWIKPVSLLEAYLHFKSTFDALLWIYTLHDQETFIRLSTQTVSSLEYYWNSDSVCSNVGLHLYFFLLCRSLESMIYWSRDWDLCLSGRASQFMHPWHPSTRRHASPTFQTYCGLFVLLVSVKRGSVFRREVEHSSNRMPMAVAKSIYSALRLKSLTSGDSWLRLSWVFMSFYPSSIRDLSILFQGFSEALLPSLSLDICIVFLSNSLFASSIVNFHTVFEL